MRSILLTILVAAGLLTATGTASAAYPTCSTGTRISADRNPGAICNPRGSEGSRYWDTDFGHYGSYAGKVTIDGRGRCVYAIGAVDSNRDGNTDNGTKAVRIAENN